MIEDSDDTTWMENVLAKMSPNIAATPRQPQQQQQQPPLSLPLQYTPKPLSSSPALALYLSSTPSHGSGSGSGSGSANVRMTDQDDSVIDMTANDSKQFSSGVDESVPNGEAAPYFSSLLIFTNLLIKQRDEMTDNGRKTVPAGYIFEPTVQEKEMCMMIDKVYYKIKALINKPRDRRYTLNESKKKALEAKLNIIASATAGLVRSPSSSSSSEDEKKEEEKEKEKTSSRDESIKKKVNLPKGFCFLIDSKESKVIPFFINWLSFVFITDLPVGDYWWILDVLLLYFIERKEEHDYMGSLHTGHLDEQKSRMCQLPLPRHRQAILYEGGGEFPTTGLIPLNRNSKGNTGWRPSVGTPSIGGFFQKPSISRGGRGRGGRGRGGRGRGGRGGMGNYGQPYKPFETIRKAEANAIHRDGFQWRRSKCLLDTVLLLYTEILSFLEKGCYYNGNATQSKNESLSQQSMDTSPDNGSVNNNNNNSGKKYTKSIGDMSVSKALKLVPADKRKTGVGLLAASLDLIEGISHAPAMAIAEKFGSPAALMDKYRELKDQDDRDELLTGIEFCNDVTKIKADTGKPIIHNLTSAKSSFIYRQLHGLPTREKKPKQTKRKTSTKKASTKKGTLTKDMIESIKVKKSAGVKRKRSSKSKSSGKEEKKETKKVKQGSKLVPIKKMSLDIDEGDDDGDDDGTDTDDDREVDNWKNKSRSKNKIKTKKRRVD